MVFEPSVLFPPRRSLGGDRCHGPKVQLMMQHKKVLGFNISIMTFIACLSLLVKYQSMFLIYIFQFKSDL